MRNRKPARPQARKLPSSEIGPLSWRYLIIVVMCGCVLAAGFFLAARLHFTSMDFGIKNSKLRKQLEGLEAENRRLLLAREVSLSPGEIKKVAKNLGFREINSESIVISAVSEASKAKNEMAKSTNVKSTKLPNIILTAYQRPAKTPLSDLPHEKSKQKVAGSKDKKESPEISTIAKLR